MWDLRSGVFSVPALCRYSTTALQTIKSSIRKGTYVVGGCSRGHFSWQVFCRRLAGGQCLLVLRTDTELILLTKIMYIYKHIYQIIIHMMTYTIFWSHFPGKLPSTWEIFPFHQAPTLLRWIFHQGALTPQQSTPPRSERHGPPRRVVISRNG